MRPFFVTPAKAGVPLKKRWIPSFAGMTMLLLAAPASSHDKTPPFWASSSSPQAMKTTGPGNNYPGTWL